MSTKALRGLTNEELKAELERRKEEERQAAKPRVQEQIDWSRVLHEAQGIVDDCFENGAPCDIDYGEYIFEAVMEAIYGPKFFDWWNAQD